MAKVSELKFNLNGVDHKVPVNVGVDGIFKANLPREISDVLKITSEIRASKLQDLQVAFYTSIERYKLAETTQELLIAIRYGSSGEYNWSSRNCVLFGNDHKKYRLGNSYGDCDAIGFEFEVLIKETVDGVESKYQTSDKIGHMAEEEDLNGYYKRRVFYGAGNYIFIPFNAIHLQSLINARENLRKLSEMLFNFVEQDTEQIQLTLSTGKLLLGE